ncbi:MAG: S8 family serine peptidase [Bacteroidetes bacterium]|nr:S8 family serine peptidase [Bacteroidota bacterium]
MKKTYLIMAILISALFARAQEYTIKINEQSLEPQTSLELLKNSKGDNSSEVIILQFFKSPTQKEIKDLERKGIKLGQYVQSNAYYARISKDFKYSSVKKSNLRAAFETKSLQKVAPDFRRDTLPKHITKGDYLKVIVTYNNLYNEEEINQRIKSVKTRCTKIFPTFNQIHVDLTLKEIESLSKEDWVTSIFPETQERIAYDIKGKQIHGYGVLTSPSPAIPEGLTGKGIKAGIWDADVLNHADLYGRITNREMEDRSTPHGTHVAGIMAGAGNIDYYAQGVAPEMEIYSWNFNRGSNELPEALEMDISAKENGISLTQNSYGMYNPVGSPWAYDPFSANLDVVANIYPNLLHVFAAGNSRGYGPDYFTVSNAAKNILMVANIAPDENINPSSSFGPVFDGHLCPHISAIGTMVYSSSYNDEYIKMTGTSQACPLVSGVAGLLMEYYKEQNNNEDAVSTLIKATICNSAKDIDNPGPDYKSGFGILNAPNALKILKNKNYKVATLEKGEAWNTDIYIPENTEELRVMIVWNDPVTTPVYGPALVNNLDLSLEHNSNTYLPWVLDPLNPNLPAKKGIDNINNIEQVTITKPEAGRYKINVNPILIPKGTQEFSLVYFIDKKGVDLLFPLGSEVFFPGEPIRISWITKGLEGFTEVQFSIDNGKTFETIEKLNEGIDFLDFYAPQQAGSKYVVRVVSNGKSALSKAFSVLGRSTIISEAKENGTLIKWNKIKDASSYNVLSLIEGKFKKEATVEDTFYLVNSVPLDKKTYYTVEALKNDESIIASRSFAILVEGKQSITNIPFTEDFEKDVISNFTTEHGKNACCYIDYDANSKSKVFMMNGGWQSDWDWMAIDKIDDNPNHISSLKLNEIDATSLENLMLTVDLKFISNIYINAQNMAWLKVVINGNTVADIQAKDLFGTEKIEAGSRNPNIPIEFPWGKKYFDLSSYCGGKINIEFRGACSWGRGVTRGFSDGDMVLIDNIKIEEKAEKEIALLGIEPIKCAMPNDSVEVSMFIANMGTIPASNVKVSCTVNAGTEYEYIYNETLTNTIAPWTTDTITLSKKIPLTQRNYSHEINLKIESEGDANTLNNKFTQNDIDNYEPVLTFQIDPTWGFPMSAEVELNHDTIFTDYQTEMYPYPGRTFGDIKVFPGDKTKKVKVTFSKFDLGTQYDVLNVKNDNFEGKLLAELKGTEIPAPITSTSVDGALHFYFNSEDFMFSHGEGWVATLSLEEKLNIDIGSLDILSPTTFVNAGTYPLMVTIGNFGVSEITEVKLNCKINDEAAIVETIALSEPLLPGDTTSIQFTNPIDLSVWGKEYNIVVTTILESDANSSNNQSQILVVNDYPRTNPGPYTSWYMKSISVGENNFNYTDYMYSLVEETISISSDNLTEVKILVDGNGASFVTPNELVLGIDWNKDGIFSPEENYPVNQLEMGKFEAKIIPPDNAPKEVRRMRISCGTWEKENKDFKIIADKAGALDVSSANFVNLKPVMQNGNYAPIVNIYNNYINTVNGSITLKIDDSYTKTINVSIDAFANNEVSLETFELTSGLHNATAIVNFEGDDNKSNDTLKLEINSGDYTIVYGYNLQNENTWIGKTYLEKPAYVEKVTNTPSCIALMGGTWANDKWYVTQNGIMSTMSNISTINIETGEQTILTEFLPPLGITSLSYFDGNGKLYATGITYNNPGDQHLYRFDIADGAEPIDMGQLKTRDIHTSLAIDMDGNFYSYGLVKNMLYKIDTTTLEAIPVLKLSYNINYKNTLEFNKNDGKLYFAGIDLNNGSKPYLIKIDPVSKEYETIGEIAYNHFTALGIPYANETAQKLVKLISFDIEEQIAPTQFDNTNKQISVFMEQGASIAALKPVFKMANGGKLFINATEQESAVSEVNFTQDVVYTLKSADESVSEEWTVKVINTLSHEALIETFKLEKANNALLNQDIEGTIDGLNINLEIPSSTSLNDLVSTYSLSEKAKAFVDETEQEGGVTHNDFSDYMIYQINSSSELFTNYYNVNVTRNQNSACELIGLRMEAEDNTSLDADVVATIEGDKVNLENSSYENMVIRFETSYGATVSINDGNSYANILISGLSVDSTITVTSEDNQNTKTYTVTNNTTGFDNIVNDYSLTIYPNPATEYFTFNSMETGLVKIYNIQGSLIQSNTYHKGSNLIKISDILAGVYLVEIQSGNKTYRRQLIKQ